MGQTRKSNCFDLIRFCDDLFDYPTIMVVNALLKKMTPHHLLYIVLSAPSKFELDMY
jgi:hypothetical protein